MLRRPVIRRLLQPVRRAPLPRLVCLLTLAVLFLPRSVTWARPATQDPPPYLLISEVMADPNAVDDRDGEWIEIANPTGAPVNLRNWRLRNLSDGEHVILSNVIVPPAGLVVLAREPEPARNGGVSPAYIYRDVQFANAVEQLQLLDPGQQVVDTITWGDGTRPAAPTGASWERTALDPAAAWVAAYAPWPGSAGDYGSPGAPYTPPPTATPTPTSTATATATAMATATPTDLPTATPPPAVPPRLYLSELMIDPAAAPDATGEWVELFNADTAPVHLAGWVLADDGTDRAELGDVWIQPGQYLVVARSIDAAQNGGVIAQGLYAGMALANEADELRLVTPWGVDVDRVVWGPGGPLPHAGASLERTAFDDATWVPAQSPWPGSAGDLGTPGSPYVPPPTPTPTATVPAQPPRLYLSELMIDPAAVADEMGEWIEVYNGDGVAVDLAGWSLVDRHGGQFPLPGGSVAPNAYAVVARQGDPAQNGGVIVLGTYTGLQLANDGGTLTLVAPWGTTVDQVAWGDAGPAAPRGASLERTGFDEGGAWVMASAPWPGSAGDAGSPGSGYVAPPPPTPTATPLPPAWPLATTPGALQIDQVYAAGSDDEYIVLANVSSAPVSLDGWRVGDAEVPGKGEGMVQLPAGMTLGPGARLVLARDAAAFRARWSLTPGAAWGVSDGSVPLLDAARQLGTREIALNNQGDEVLLIDPAGYLVDVLAYGDAAYAILGVTGSLSGTGDQAFLRAPGAPFPIVRDLRHRFLRSAPDPSTSYAFPTPQSAAPVALADGLFAWWGTLGAYSTFSAAGTAPPHVLLAEAAAQRLDFVAIADTDREPNDVVRLQPESSVTLLPAWRWTNVGGANAIVYGTQRALPLSWGDLFDHLARTDSLAQLPAEMTPVDSRTPLFAADDLYAPGGLGALYARWAAASKPLLPAGNRQPPVRGSEDTRLLYTGLAAPDAAPSALLAAVAAARGWLTSSPDLWLTLRSDAGVWMGSNLTPGNEVALSVGFGDRQGEPVAVALWQDDHVVRQLDLPPEDGHWQVTVPAVPGTFLFAVATQRDGDFAVTAPLYVAPVAGGSVLINEVLPAPNLDLNGDGETNTDDEFIELYNPGSAPFTLTGWQLHDAGEAGHHFTFGPGRFIGAGEHLVLWRQDTGLSLNDDGDGLWLLDPDGEQVDQVEWTAVTRGESHGRLPDGADWRRALLPTPGRANEAVPVEPPRPPSEPEFDPVDVAEPRSPVFGQATGAPGSLALGKLRGLYAAIEFRGQVTAPPGLFNSAMYVAEAAGEPTVDATGTAAATAGLGVQVYLAGGDFIPMQEGDWVLVRGTIRSFRGEMEIRLDEPGRAWRIGPGTPLRPLPVRVAEIGESLEGRLVTFEGVVTGWQGDSIYLGDEDDATAAPIRVTVRSSLDWRRPYVQLGERYRVVGIVSQFATEAPWNDGYRVLVRYERDLVKLNDAPANGEKLQRD